MGRDRDSGLNRVGWRDSEEKKAGKRDLRTPILISHGGTTSSHRESRQER